MLPRIERVLTDCLAQGARGIGQVLITQQERAISLRHRADEARDDLQVFYSPNDARELAKLDDDGNFRPLKTAPNLRHGWRLDLADLTELRQAVDLFYPGRLTALAAWREQRLTTTTLRQTLNRQTGMYRVAARISDDQIDEMVGRVCRSRGGKPGCLRTILWTRDATAARPSLQLPADKFIPTVDQNGRGENIMPLLCQEACNLLVAEALSVVKTEETAR
jgi:sirohydrochlorin cobaltochelatase